MLKRRNDKDTEKRTVAELPLHVKYRPTTFKTFVGNKATVTSLKAVLDKGRVRVFMFSGPAGTGKTTLGYIIKNYLGCSDKDFYEHDLAKAGGVDVIRDIIAECRYAPIHGEHKIYLLDECHMMQQAASNALLKILENCPAHVRFILCTTEPGKVIKTIQTRCSKFSVSSLTPVELLDMLEYVIAKEKLNVSDRVLKELIIKSEGSAREALVKLDQIAGSSDKDDDVLEAIINGSINNAEAKTAIDLCRALLYNEKWGTIAKILDKMTAEPEVVRRTLLNYMTKVAIGNRDAKGTHRAIEIIRLCEKNWYDSGKAGLVKAAFLATYTD